MNKISRIKKIQEKNKIKESTVSQAELNTFVMNFVAHTNNFLMEQEFKGDSTLAAAELMKQCHVIYTDLVNRKTE